MGNNIILETKFVADIRGSFYIPSYQRGYFIKVQMPVLKIHIQF